ncbi:MAG: hypothetical protein LC742_00385 [Acidobacteria bacterium]|nr:hypothetical protein [Acidobacteriota bacterium]
MHSKEEAAEIKVFVGRINRPGGMKAEFDRLVAEEEARADETKRRRHRSGGSRWPKIQKLSFR